MPATPSATSVVPSPPGSAEGVRDDDADLDARELANPLAQTLRRCVGVDGQEDELVRPAGVRRVDSRRGTDEAVPRLGDDERRAGTDDLASLAQNHLDSPRIGVAGELTRSFGRLDPVERDDPALDLRYRLLRDDEHVVALEAAGPSGGFEEERTEIVPVHELRDPRQRDDAELAAQPRPVTRIPACPL